MINCEWIRKQKKEQSAHGGSRSPKGMHTGRAGRLRVKSANTQQPCFSALCDAWLLRKRDEIRESSYIKYRAILERHIKPRLGSRRLGGICTASVEEKVPPFLEGKGLGWVTAEYAMLPRATSTRKKRDIKSLKLDGRSSEIQRLIGRALRAVVDREALGERQITIDCDVIQADGGTRCASITGGYAALYLACRKLVDEGVIEKMPLTAAVSAVSVGIFEDEAVLDLNYAEDSHAIVDCNVVMTSKGEFIEVQGTGEGRPFTRNELDQLLALGEQGCSRLCEIQRSVLGE